MDNPFIKPGSIKVDELFTKKGFVCPFLGPPPFENIEQMLATFDKPEELYIVTYAEEVQAIARKRDRDYIELKRQLVDQFIAKLGKKFGDLSPQDAIWVYEQVERALLESN